MSAARLAASLAGALLAVVLAAFLLLHARSIDPAAHSRVIANLSKLQELDSELDEIVLKLRDALLNNYDPLVVTLNAMKAHRRDLERGDYAIVRWGGAQLEPALAQVAGKMAEKEALVERFKSRNALLRNSYHYFPRSVEVLLRDPQVSPRTRAGAQALQRDTLLLRQGATPGDHELIALQIAQLRARQPGESTPARDKLGVVLQHGQNVLEHHAQLDRLLRDITAMTVRRAGRSLAEAYNRAFEKKLKEANLYRFVLLLVSIGLLTYAASSFRRLRRSEQQLRLTARALENAVEGVMITDRRRRIVTVNKAFTRITGYSPLEVIGRDSVFLRSEEHGAAFYERLWSDVRDTGTWHGELSRRRKDGSIYPESRSISAVKDAAGNVTHFVAVFSDISQLQQTKARLEFLAHHDALTSLPNRTLFEDRLQKALSRAHRYGGGVGLLFIDLDRFKDVNDSHGHGVGDQLLQAVTARLKACVREADTVGRLGGDEFAVLVDGLPESQHAARVAEKVLAALGEPFALGPHEVFISGSIGVSCYPQDGADAQSLLKNADAAMYRAKQQGRDNFQFFSSEMNAHALERLAITNHLRAALERNELLLHYQPIVELASGRLKAVEALVRWRHPEAGYLLPGRFIAHAEDSGLIVPIGEWVLRNACARMKAWHDAGIAPQRMAVNLSARQFRQKDLARRIEAILAEAGLAPQHLELEITESMVMADPAEAEKVLHQLHDFGICLAIDDFGTGYSSLSYLKRFPIDFLKIDRSFVHDIPQSADDMAIARSIIALAKGLGLWVIAEGVETDSQRAFFEAEGCEEAQGYYFGRPGDAEQIESLLRMPALPPAGPTAAPRRRTLLRTI